LAEKYPESHDPDTPPELVYAGQKKLTDAIAGLGLDAGKLVLSPTRTYAPVIKQVLGALRPQIHGIIHASGGGQTKILHFIDRLRVIKDRLLPVPPLFQLIKEESGADWQEMYQVFNMGHRMEIYLPEAYAEEVIQISQSFGIEAQRIGRVEASDRKELIIESKNGRFEY
jgi:phosphoribosylformylglycinamidine cyclo-ligase